jgi:hypothetical protein
MKDDQKKRVLYEVNDDFKLDTTASEYTNGSFEQAVIAAASITASSARVCGDSATNSRFPARVSVSQPRLYATT